MLTRMSRPFIFALVALAGFESSPAFADPIFLVGFEVYAANPGGESAGGGFKYTSNINDTTFTPEALTLSGGSTQTSAISFALTTGVNTFTFVPPSDVPLTNLFGAGIELFLSTSSTSFNPTTNGIAGNLVVYQQTNVNGAPLGATGIEVEDYGPGIGNALYTGPSSASLLIGGETVTVTNLFTDINAAGSITLAVSSVPEPNALVLLGLGTAGLLFHGRRHTRK
jgi:hypothetical protein